MNKLYTQKNIRDAKKLVDLSNSILILAPDSQDGDSVSANLALKNTFEQMGKTVYWVSEKGSNKQFDYLEGNEACDDKRKLKSLEDRVDLVVLADLGSKSQIEKSLETAPWILQKSSIIFDHHYTRDANTFDVEIVDETAAATGLLLAEVYPELKWRITPRIANYLLAGIYADTASFTNLNTTQRVFEISANLTKLGADPAKLSQDYLINSGPGALELKTYANLLNKVSIKDHVAYALINYSDIESLENSNMSHRVGDTIRYMQGVRISFVITEKMPGKYYLSMRSLANYNVSKIAESFGGGGHKVAAGAKFDDSYTSIIQASKAVLKLAIKEAKKS